MDSSQLSVQEFYNQINNEYTEAIIRCVPRYVEMQWAILRYIPDDLRPLRILDLGCGAGNLSDLVIRKFPDAEVHLVDISDKMIDLCTEKYKDKPQVIMHRADFRELPFTSETFDLVVSSISIHHIQDPDKSALFSRLYQIMNPGGVFCYSDQFRGITEEIYSKHIQSWKEESVVNGISETEWKMWMDHQEQHDHHTTLEHQLAWLRKAGFKDLDCVWRHLLWTVVSGVK